MARYYFDPDAVLAIHKAKDADPQKIGEELDRLTSANGGRLETQIVVNAAKSSRSVLHKHFEWNVERAANAHWNDQARKLIASIRIVADHGTEKRMTRGFVSISDDDGRAYHHLETVLTNRDLQLRFLQRAEADLNSFERRYRQLKEICELVEVARETVRRKISEMEARPQ